MSRADPFACAVLLAAGRSTRMGAAGSPDRKPFLELAGRPVLEHAARAFEAAETVRSLVVVALPEDFDRIDRMVAGWGFRASVTTRVAGGAERTDSVRAGVRAAPPDDEVILVHDVARPLVRPAHVDAVARTARTLGAALLAVPARDTLKSSPDGIEAVATLDRSRIWIAQTPQGFRAERLRELLAEAEAAGIDATDDAALHERFFGPVPLVEGEPENLKLTTPGDLRLAAAILAGREREP